MEASLVSSELNRQFGILYIGSVEIKPNILHNKASQIHRVRKSISAFPGRADIRTKYANGSKSDGGCQKEYIGTDV